MVDSRENYKFDLGVGGLMTHRPILVLQSSKKGKASLGPY